MVEIGRGAPSFKYDIRLGDVAVSAPGPYHGGVLQYDLGKFGSGGKFVSGSLNAPPRTLITAMAG
jgi:hypothetical protein